MLQALLNGNFAEKAAEMFLGGQLFSTYAKF